MRAARMHGYNQPLVLEDVAVPDMAADEVLVVSVARATASRCFISTFPEFRKRGSLFDSIRDRHIVGLHRLARSQNRQPVEMRCRRAWPRQLASVINVLASKTVPTIII